MTKLEFDALPLAAQPPAEEHRERLMESARFYRKMFDSMMNGMSGADRADAYKYDLVADGLGCIASGKELEATIAMLRAKWETYAKLNNARVEAAPKVKRGPYSGQSCIHYQHVSPDFDDLVLRSAEQAPAQKGLFR